MPSHRRPHPAADRVNRMGQNWRRISDMAGLELLESPRAAAVSGPLAETSVLQQPSADDGSALGGPALGSEAAGAEVTALLQRWGAGDATALDALLPLVYADLRGIARRELYGHRGHDTLQPTALVNDVFVRLLGSDRPQCLGSRAHLFNTAARIMRQLLVDRARRAACDKHGGAWKRDDFACALDLPIPECTVLPELDAALDELARLDERMAKVVELRYFTGLSVAEVARLLEVEERTVYRDWAAARAWLRDRLSE